MPPVLGELAFIEALRRIATHPAARGLYNDAAVIEFAGEALVITHDTLAEGVHFLPGQDPVDVAWKRALRTILNADAVSFLAAVILYFVSVGGVRGFAFTLGLSTILDIVVVVMFTTPWLYF